MKIFLPLTCFFSSLGMSAHTIVTFQPDTDCAKDAVVLSHRPTMNYGAYADFLICAWTYQGNPGSVRALVSFDLACIPPGVTIVNATMNLYHYQSPMNVGHSNLSAPATAWLERITQPWSESTVTWNNQPATTLTNRISIPASVSPTQNYSIDVTTLVIDMINDPANSDGFMFRQQTESYYRSLLFASSNMGNPALHPKLVVTYSENIPPLNGCYSFYKMDDATSVGGHTAPDPVVHFPNVFTPDGDGINDLFYPDSSNVNAEGLTVYNRWGVMVCDSSKEPWDGKHNGKECAEGTYYYVFRFRWNGAPGMVTGFTTLIR